MLEIKYSKLSEIPENYQDLYTFNDETKEYILSKVNLPPSKEKDFQNVYQSLKKERSDHSKTKEKLKFFSDVNKETLHADLAELEELRITSSKFENNEEKIQNLVNARLKPYEREKEGLKSKIDEYTNEISKLKSVISSKKIKDSLLKTAHSSNVLRTAIDDVLMYASLFEVTEEGDVLHKEERLSPEIWLLNIKEKKPHWWESSVGSGAKGDSSLGKITGIELNPWDKNSWNLTEQIRITREHGQDKANQLKKLARK